MTAIRATRVTQHSQIFSLFFRNRIQCIVLYQLHNSQAYAVATSDEQKMSHLQERELYLET